MYKSVGWLAPVITAGASFAHANNQKDVAVEVITWGTSVKSSSVFMGNEDLDIKQADHISDLLRTIPGVDVGGAHSLNQRITIRSIEDRDIQITIDGASQNNYMYHHMGNLQIHADILQSVDIDVGKNSILHGGLGGAIKFETKSAEELLSGNQAIGGLIKSSVSSNASNDLAVSAYGKQDDLDFLFYYNRVQKNDYEVGGGAIKDANGLAVEGTDGKVRGLEGTVDSALMKFGWDLASNQRLKVGYEYYQDKGDYSYRPDMGLATDQAISDGTGTPLTWPTEYLRDTLTLNYDADFGRTTLSASVFNNSSELWRDENGWAQSSVARFQSSAGIIEGAADNSGINAQLATTLGEQVKHNIILGGESVSYKTDYKVSYTSGDSLASSEDKIDHSLYFQDRIVINEQFSVTPGVRVDNVNIESNLVDDHFTQTSLALSASYQPRDALVFRLSSTELFKAPELAEVFIGAGSGDTANPEIDAETGVNTEFAVAYGDDVLGADLFTLGATIFSTSIDQYIYDYAAPDPTNSRIYWKDNVGDAQISGFEAYIGYSLGSIESLMSYSTNDSEIDANNEYSHYDGARLDRVQGDTLSFELSYNMSEPKIDFLWEFSIVDALQSVDASLQLDGAGTDNSKPGHSVHNIAMNWQVIESLSLVFGIDNVFDEYYVSQSSRTGVTNHPVFGPLFLNDYEPGRNIKASANFRF